MPNMERLKELSMIFDPTLLTQLVEGLPDAVLVINRKGHVILMNMQCELLFGHHRASVIGQPVEMLLPVELRSAHERFRERFFADPRQRPMGSGQVLSGLHQDGRIFEVEINISPLVSADGLCAAAVLRRRRTDADGG